MKWHRVILKVYRLAGRAARVGFAPLLPLRLGKRTIGQLIDGCVRKLITPAIRAPNPAMVQGHIMWYLPGQVFHQDYMTLDNYEPETTRLVRRLLRPGMTFVDLGAHVGYYTLIAARQVANSGHVYAFEPAPQAADVLKRNIAANRYERTVTIVLKAVSDDVGRRQFVLPRVHQSMSSFYVGNTAAASFIQVETTSLDAFFTSLGWPQVDLVKMDVEGAEKAALYGMAEMIRRNSDLKLIVEFAPKPMRAAGVLPREFFALLQAVGFDTLSIIHRQLQPLQVPEGIPRLLCLAHDEAVNLLCEKQKLTAQR